MDFPTLADCLPFWTSVVFKGTDWGLSFWIEVQDCSVVVWGRVCCLIMACLWPGISLDLNSLGARVGTVLCLGCGMFVWPIMAVCVDCCFGHLLCQNWS